MNYTREYIDALIKDLESLKVYEPNINELVRQIMVSDNVYIIGNGGSASTAQHFAQGLCDAGVKAWSLSDDIALFSAIANDIDYESVYEKQLMNILSGKDLVIGISGSGKSKNIVRGIKCANQNARSFCLLGFDGGILKDISPNILIADNSYGRVEDAHLSIAHIVSYLVKERNNDR